MRKGQKMTNEIKLKISNSEKGKIVSNYTKEKLRNTMKKQFKEGTRKIVVPKISGEKHYNWKGGQTKEKRNWQKNKRNRVIKRLKIKSLSHTFGEWELLKVQYGFTCPCCKKSEPEIKLTEDHIIPLSKGGSDLIENIQPLCLFCNMKKHTNLTKF